MDNTEQLREEQQQSNAYDVPCEMYTDMIQIFSMPDNYVKNVNFTCSSGTGYCLLYL